MGPGGCTVSGITIPRGGVVGSGGVDAGSPPADSGSAEPRFVVDTYSYGGGTSFGTDVIGHIDIEGEFGRPTAISADELLWVGFRTGVLRGYDIATGEVEITVLVHTDPAGTPNRINNLQMYRDSGRLFGVAALGVGIARFEIVGTSLVDRGFVRTSFSTDARIHPNEVLRDDGYVVGVTVPGTANELIVIPRIDSTGAFAPQTTSLTLTPRSVAPEAVANGFVFTGERNLVDGAAETFRTCASGTPSTCSAGDLTLVGSAEFTGATVMGIGGPDETATVAFDLIVAVNGATVGSLIAFDPVTYATRDTMMLDGLVSTFATRAVGSELYAFATTTATGRAPAELVAVIPTAGLSVRAMRELSSVDQVIDLAVGLEPFFEPPEPDDPLPVGSTAAIHLLIERP